MSTLSSTPPCPSPLLDLRHCPPDHAEAHLEPHFCKSCSVMLFDVVLLMTNCSRQIMCVIIDALYYFGGYLGDTYFSSWVYGMCPLFCVVWPSVRGWFFDRTLAVVKDWSFRDYTFL